MCFRESTETNLWMDKVTLFPRFWKGECTLSHSNVAFTFPREQVKKAMIAAQRKEKYRESKQKTESAQNLISLFCPSISIIQDVYFDDALSYLLLFEGLQDAKKEEKKCYKAYREAKTSVRNLLSGYWSRRIRFASRAIGNMFDYTLITEPVPPTTVPADEFIMNYGFFVRQQGGALVGNLA